MKVLCWGNKECDQLVVLDICAAFYDGEVDGLVLKPSVPEYCDYCLAGIPPAVCNMIISHLYDKGCYNFRKFDYIRPYGECC